MSEYTNQSIFTDNRTLENYIVYDKHNKHQIINKILLHSTGVYLFFESKESISVVQNSLLSTTYQFLQTAGTNMYNVVIYHTQTLSDTNIYSYLNTYNDRIIPIIDLFADINEKMNERINIFDDYRLLEIENAIYFNCDTGEKIKYDLDNQAYIKRNGKWCLASEENSDNIFWLTAFGGCFGLHKIKKGNIALALLYFLSCGLFALGWVFDLLELLIGVAKDKEKKYLMPLTHKKQKWLVFIFIVVVSFILLFLYIALLRHLIDIIHI